VLSDYDSSAIALLDGRGEPITESWIDSGTRGSAIASGIGGDVVLVERLRRGWLAILERYQSDVLTLASFHDGTARQIDLRGDDRRLPIGHSPNPQDAVRLDERHALVARLNPAFDPRTPELARGNDLVVVDLASGSIEARIDLGADVEVPSPFDPAQRVVVYARPSALALLQRGATRRVVVGLARLSADFTVSGPGAFAVVDPDARTTLAVLTPTAVRNCHSVRPVPDDAARVMALCSGPAFAGVEARRAEAALLRLALDEDGTVSIEARYDAAGHPQHPPPTSGLVPLDATRALVVADPRGESGATVADWLLLVELEAAHARVVLEATKAFVLGQGTYDPERALALVPDAAALVVHRLEVGASVVVGDAVRLPSCRTLPPRQVVRVEP